ncbi:ABC transporter permease [Burkholderia oklahomensis]|uniref:Binding--dependent transport system inner membrane component family protein n=2 Tax=Burkholderia oklahomensis TaxID=342113 RepID=A0AAI8BB06_9BURK|nr:ABC transporter permease [Burkholderia oklahomensis]AIO68744.1 binding--dependent transport system inner membrane component family protein [Burkholderia oklahomensis]AJX35727.1 binding--dependent transport system inner membrane component family protein [Burkholderia oklahomensis C6786]AOI39107.1 peptide ABC transporter permease [Burkholderia oklahomensis EO147]AOI48795.1 peptide ABC transporter permease [Burkholderia oklahomensis C6786]KUY50602.1 peptide ABC transporter permease [Burkholder
MSSRPHSLPAPRIDAPARPAWRRATRRLLGHRGLAIGAALVALVVLAAWFAPWLAPHDPYGQDLTRRLLPPVWDSARGSWLHPLGTDKLGRDYLSRLLFGARVSLVIGVASAALSGVIGTALGVLAGYFGGKVDAAISYLITTRLAMPVVLVALAMSSLLGGSLKTVIVLLGLLLWDRFAVVSRSVAQQLRDAEFIAAAKAVGASTPYILLRELLPNIAGALIVVATLEMAHAILLEATLSFLGLGVPAPMPSWGLMIAEGKAYMFFQPWVILIPGVALAITVLAINLVGDGIRDLTAPEGR